MLLYPSWVCGTQAMYNGVAGAYEMPGLSDTRQELLEVAAGQGFAPVAEYGTPELSLTDPAGAAARREAREELWETARALGLWREDRALRPTFFPNRNAVTLVRGRDIIAMTAYGPWEEYLRYYGRPLFGITSVQVEASYRGKKLGKLVMLLALEAARRGRRGGRALARLSQQRAGLEPLPPRAGIPAQVHLAYPRQRPILVHLEVADFAPPAALPAPLPSRFRRHAKEHGVGDEDEVTARALDAGAALHPHQRPSALVHGADGGFDLPAARTAPSIAHLPRPLPQFRVMLRDRRRPGLPDQVPQTNSGQQYAQTVPHGGTAFSVPAPPKNIDENMG